jgi:SNF2 family DNA or RNA helicase
MQVTIEIAKCGTDNVIDIMFPYSPSLVDKVKQVSGRKWHKEGRHWHAPLDMESCRSLRRIFGKDLVIGPELRSWAFNAKRNEERLGSIALGSEAPPLPVLQSKLKKAYEAVWLGPLGRFMTPEQREEALKGPGSFQAADVAYVTASPTPLIGNEQGTGKTLTWIASVWNADLEEGNHLVICPRAAIDGTWEGELKTWQEGAPKDVEIFACVDQRNDREEVLERFRKSTAAVKWVIVNPAMVQYVKDPTRTSKKCVAVKGAKAQKDACYCKARKGPHEHYTNPYPVLHETHWTTLCIDEAHKGSIRNHRSLTSMGMFDLNVPEKRTAMSGTPMKKKGGHDIWGILNWLQPKVFTSSWRFWETYFVIDDNGYGKKVGNLKPGVERDFFAMLTPYMLRRLKKEVAPWLPEKHYIPVNCTMGDRQRKQYLAMHESALVEFGDRELSATETLAKFTRLKQFANAYCNLDGDRLVPVESCKVDALLEKMDEAGMFDEGETRKQLVFSQSLEMVRFVAETLRAKGLSVEIISGRDNKKSAQRKALIDRFQNGDLRVLVIVTTAGGVSLTLDSADEVHLLDEMWSPDEDQQAEDRAHRVSRIHQVTVFIYRTIDTIDDYIMETKADKADTHTFILDTRRKMLASK